MCFPLNENRQNDRWLGSDSRSETSGLPTSTLLLFQENFYKDIKSISIFIETSNEGSGKKPGQSVRYSDSTQSIRRHQGNMNSVITRKGQIDSNS